jgi:RNA polymerase sigma-70 factor, ECF subfamily
LDENGLRSALVENREAVYRYLLKMSGDAETARDLTQDVMVKAILTHGKFRGDCEFRTWLIAIAVNLYRDSLRKRKTIRIGDRTEIGDGNRGEDGIIRKLDAQAAARSLAALPEKKRRVLVLRTEFGFSYEEISRILGCPVGTVRSRIHEAYAELRLAMGVGNDR